MSDFYKSTKHTAAKVHHCDWCGKIIVFGEVYHYICGVNDGDFGTLKYHLKCNGEMQETSSTHNSCNDLSVDDLRECFLEDQEELNKRGAE